MYNLSAFPSVCRICIKPTKDCSIQNSVSDNARITYETVLNEITFVPQQEFSNEIPSFLCDECAGRLDEFVQFKQQSTLVLHFCIALVDGKRCKDFSSMQELFKQGAQFLKQRLCALNNVVESDFCLQQLFEDILCKSEPPDETIKTDPVVGLKIEEIKVEELETESVPSPAIVNDSFNESSEPETDTDSDELVSSKRKRKRKIHEPKTAGKIIHRDGARFKLCGLAGCNEEYELGNRGLYLAHERKFHRWACDLCGRVLASRTSFRNHVLLHDGEKAKCEFCDRTFTTKGSMMTHVREIHNTSGVNFTCFYCGEGFMEQKDHFAHMAEHRQCKHCDKRFADTATWIAHTRRKHPDMLFSCDQCDRTSLSQTFLDRHKRMKHSTDSSKEPQPKRFTVIAINGAMFHHCPQCNAQFTTEPFLLQHNKDAHNRQESEGQKQEQIIKRRSREEREKFGYRYSCDTCGKWYRFKNSLWSHKNKEHRSVEKKAICDICGNHFKHQSYLTAHIAKMHATELPFKCELCPKAYSHAPYLKEHMKSHDPDKSFNCPHCDYLAKQAHVLETHIIRKHTTERPIRCPECDKGFIRSADLRRHMSVHSVETPFRCGECGEAFRRKCDLGWHRSKVHLGLGTKQRKSATSQSAERLESLPVEGEPNLLQLALLERKA
ncbi:zinc finger protein 845-like [Wyeomyia smithii]|uniref:zinc finger protein 845-like n=1 Tax=Wyeomyia smithii TaxID=174621 RepID=UPI002467E8B9|nr:zinc finger protein 845-like [Wyeomyia smithii]